MKIRWNRINRGLVLFSVLVMGTAVYVIGQNIAFKQKAPELKARADQLGREMAETNLGTNSDAITRNQLAYIQNNFISGKTGSMDLMGATMTKSDFIYGVQNKDMYMYDEGDTVTTNDEVLSVEYEQVSASVEKGGPTSAFVKVDYKVSYECTGVPKLLTYTNIEDMSWMIESDDRKPEHKMINAKGSVTFTMRPDDGEWKVVAISGGENTEWDIEYDEDIQGGES